MSGITMARLIIIAALTVMSIFSVGCVEEDETPPENTFSLQEVAQHDSAEDCWIVVHGKVYNVTTIPCHGGGAESLILESCGTDATELWDMKPVTDKPHSEDAQNILNEYYIGDLD